jgi:formylglycine-generating enzyme required for sulfatase activity
VNRLCILVIPLLVACEERSSRKEELRVVLGRGSEFTFVWIAYPTITPRRHVNEDEGGFDHSQRMPDIAGGFWLCREETTQKAWKEVMGHNHSAHDSDDGLHPAECVENVQGFLNDMGSHVSHVVMNGKRTKLEIRFRLPTEIEWEYACKGGTTSTFHWGESKEAITEFGWVKCNSSNRTHKVGLKKPNNYGLYDMVGNVAELCSDTYRDDAWKTVTNVADDRVMGYRRVVIRGGSYASDWIDCQSTSRDESIEDCMRDYVGFRIIAEVRRDRR